MITIHLTLLHVNKDLSTLFLRLDQHTSLSATGECGIDWIVALHLLWRKEDCLFQPFALAELVHGEAYGGVHKFPSISHLWGVMASRYIKDKFLVKLPKMLPLFYETDSRLLRFVED